MSLVLASMRMRWVPVALLTLSLVASVFLLLASDRIKTATQSAFNRSVNGVDLIVGTRTGQIETVLYSVFNLGQPIANLDAQRIEQLRADEQIDWVVPIALGDSYGPYRVVATTDEYFMRLRDVNNQALVFDQGQAFASARHVVLGAQVAAQMDNPMGRRLQLAHGSGGLAKAHDDIDFEVVGVLAPTGTPIDQTLMVSLEAYVLLHIGWRNGQRIISLDRFADSELPPIDSVTAAFVGLKNPLSLFQTARRINDSEVMGAVVPGIALAQLWQIVDQIEAAFALLGQLIVGLSLLGILAVSLTALDARRQEFSILRACGASPWQLARLILTEAVAISLAAGLIALALVNLASWLLSRWLILEYSITPELSFVQPVEWLYILVVVASSALVALIPALMVYRRSLQQGLSD